MTDYSQLLTSEYANSPNLIQTVQLTANAIGDITTLLQSLPAQFDLDNALGSQLDIDGQWVGFARTIGGVLLVQFFGFADDATALTFGEVGNSSVGGRFIELNENASTTATLGDPEYRTLLRAKILQNDWDGSVAQFEAALADIIPVPTTTIDPGTNVVLIMPSAAVDPVLSQLLTGFDLIPRAAGVRYQFVFPQSGYAWTLAGTATSPNITTLQKLSGVDTWDSSGFVASPSTHVYVSWTVPDITGHLMGGLATNPSGSPNYATINFGLYNNGGTIQVYESGVLQGTFGTYAAGDSFAVYHDGKEAVYLHQGAPFKKTILVPGALSPMFGLRSIGCQANNIFIAAG
jgi:uncharacterized protein DUF2612